MLRRVEGRCDSQAQCRVMARVKRRSTGVIKRLQALNRLLKSKRPKSELETLCVQRAITDLEHEKRNGLIWNEEEAQRAVAFCSLLQHWQGPTSGTPFVPEPWQEHLVFAPLFGWYRQDGRRRFTESYIEIPRKNGKTFMASAIALQGLIADGEAGPEVYAAATKKDQARIVFRDASNAMRHSPALNKIAKVFKHSILCDHNQGFFQPISSDENGLHGLKTSRAVIDELHSHKSRDVYDVMTSATGSRANPIVMSITTAGYDRSSICWEVHNRAAGVLNGVEHPSFHCYLACADQEDDWRDPATWWKANPNLGISCFESKLEDDARKAAESPSHENKFRRLHLNMWTEQSVRWLPMHAWDECCGTEADPDKLQGELCYAALDVASTRDVNALALAFPRPGGRMVILVWFWVPEQAENQRAEQDRRQVMHWAHEGHIRLTEGNVADVDGQIPEDIFEILGRYSVQIFGYDPWGSAEAVIQKLVKMGFPLNRIMKFRQIMSNFAPATSEFERLVLSRRLEHEGNPVLRWMASNVAVKTDVSGNMRPDKEKSADKIDGIVAGIMAVGLSLSAEQPATPSYYDTHELESF